MNVADIFAAVHLNLETGQFETDALKASSLVGDKAGKSFGQKMSVALRGALGAGAGLAFAAVVSGARELDAATKQLQADTGMTAEEADKAEHALAGMYEHNLQGYQEIGAALAVVINGLDLTGAAADAMTQKFLTFATATGQEAAPAVSSFHELLNAWNLTAADAPAIMDKLVASHQKYGSSVTDNEDALRKLAPQMIALGMNVDDTIGLLNLFDAAGMDSSKAMFALNTAVKNLKPGQTLDDLIKQIAAIKDPTDRAQEAIKVFGARGGVNLANALKPGITSLDDFKTTMAENDKATQDAADAIKSGFGAQATLLVHQFGGALSEVATNFGPLMMGMAIIGPQLTRVLSAAVGGLVGIATATGTATGAALVTAETATVAAAGPAVAGGVAAQGPAVGVAAAAVGTSAGSKLGAALGMAARVGIIAAIAVGGYLLASGIDGYLKSGFRKSVGELTDKLATATDEELNNFYDQMQALWGSNGPPEVTEFMASVKAEIAKRKPDIAAAAADTMAGLPDATTVAGAQTVTYTRHSLAEVIAEIRGAKADLASAWSDALNAEWAPQEIANAKRDNLTEQATIKAELAEKRRGKRLNDIQAYAAQERLLALQKEYANLLVQDAGYGTKAEKIIKLGALLQSQAMKDGLASMDEDIVQMWIQIQDDTQTQIDVLNGIIDRGGHAYVMPRYPSGGGAPSGGRTGGMTPAASGMPFVAYDQPVYVHQAEAILNPSQAADWRAGGGRPQIIQLVVSGRVLAQVLANQTRLEGG